MFGGQANNFMYMGMQGLNPQSENAYATKQKISQKGLANNSFEMNQGNSGAHQHSEFDLLAFDPNSSQGGKIDVDEAEKAYRFIIN